MVSEAMTHVTVLPLDPPTGRHSRREQALADDWSTDSLAGRTLWCATSVQARHEGAGALYAHLLQAGAGAASLDEETDLALLADAVGCDDVVLLGDLGAAPLAVAAREQRAHVVWHLDIATARRREALDRVVRATDTCADSYLMSWSQDVGHGRRVERIVTVLPHADVVAAVELPAHAPAAGRRLAWSCALAETVHADRTEHVGGLLRARPSVAVR